MATTEELLVKLITEHTEASVRLRGVVDSMKSDLHSQLSVNQKDLIKQVEILQETSSKLLSMSNEIRQTCVELDATEKNVWNTLRPLEVRLFIMFALANAISFLVGYFLR